LLAEPILVEARAPQLLDTPPVETVFGKFRGISGSYPRRVRL